jgi:hypothetical protein
MHMSESGAPGASGLAASYVLGLLKGLTALLVSANYRRDTERSCGRVRPHLWYCTRKNDQRHHLRHEV